MLELVPPATDAHDSRQIHGSLYIQENEWLLGMFDVGVFPAEIEENCLNPFGPGFIDTSWVELMWIFGSFIPALPLYLFIGSWTGSLPWLMPAGGWTGRFVQISPIGAFAGITFGMALSGASCAKRSLQTLGVMLTVYVWAVAGMMAQPILVLLQTPPTTLPNIYSYEILLAVVSFFSWSLACACYLSYIRRQLTGRDIDPDCGHFHLVATATSSKTKTKDIRVKTALSPEECSKVHFLLFQSEKDGKFAYVSPNADAHLELPSMSESVHLFTWREGQRMGRLQSFSLRPSHTMREVVAIYRRRGRFVLAATLVLLIPVAWMIIMRLPGAPQWMWVNRIFGPNYWVFCGFETLFSIGGPCYAPPPTDLDCGGLPCFNTYYYDYTMANGTHVPNTPAASSNECMSFGNRIWSMANLAITWLPIEMLVLGLACGLALPFLAQSFQCLTDAINAFAWMSRSDTAQQVAFLRLMLRLQDKISRSSTVRKRFILDWLPIIPKASDPELVLWRYGAGTSSFMMTLVQGCDRADRSGLHEGVEGAPSWGWWFRSRAALQWEVSWVYWRVWPILLGIVCQWLLFLLRASSAQSQAGMIMGLVGSIVTLGVPMFVLLYLGAAINARIDNSLDTMASLVLQPQDSQYLEWAMGHKTYLTFCGWRMSSTLLLTAAASAVPSAVSAFLKG